MPIKTLESYLFDNYSVGSYPIDILKNSTIGIDVDHYISRLLTFKKESFLDAIGGFPLSLLNYIELDLKIFKELNIKPIFVFQGLRNTLAFDSKNASSELSLLEKHHKKVWDRHSSAVSSPQKPTTETFREFNSPIDSRPILNDLLKFFVEREIDYQVAPYSSFIQLTYLLRGKFVDVIYGPTDLLLSQNCEKFIFCIEFQNKEFKFLDKNFILNKFNLTEKQFLDISMVVGNDLQPDSLQIFPSSPAITFQMLHEFVTISGGSVYNTILALQDQNISEKFFKGCSVLKFMPVLKKNGAIELLNDVDGELEKISQAFAVDKTIKSDVKVPNDLHEFIGQRLSNEYYFYQSVGLVEFKSVEAILYGNYVERLPLDCSPTPLYLKLVTDDDSLELKNKTLNLLTQFMHRYYQVKKINLTTYFNENKPDVFELSHRISPPVYFKTRSFTVNFDNSHDDFEIKLFFDKINQEFVNQSISSKTLDLQEKLSSNNQIISTALLRSLYILKYIGEDNKLTTWGELLPTISKSLYSTNLFLIINFLRKFGKTLKLNDLISFNNNELKIPSSAGPEISKLIILISKILVLCPIFQTKPINYLNKFSRSLLQFRSIFAKSQEQINELLIANLYTILMNNDIKDKFKWNNRNWFILNSQLPFNRIFNSTLVGIFALHFLEIYNNNSEDLTKTKNLFLGNFNNLHNSPFEELLKGVEFFYEVAALVREIDSKGLINDKSIVDHFNKAETYLKKIFIKTEK